jgi:fructose-bisphosphate aldolase class II
MTKIKPGVVTGKAYRTLVQKAKEGGYALPAVNVVGTNSINAVLEAASLNKSDVIIQLSSGGAQFYGGKGHSDAFETRILGAVSAAQHVHLMAEHYGICVALHTDHANKELLPWVEALIDYSEDFFHEQGFPLFSSHMVDLSEEPLEENIKESARLLERMERLDLSLEIELGITGGEEDGIGHEDNINNPALYTQSEDCLLAHKTLSPIGHYSLAASFGNVHGVYKPGNVQLRPEILKAAQTLVQKECGTGPNPLNLVFHGGSGSDPRHIAEALSYGVFKMNIDTDLQFAFANGIAAIIDANPKAFHHQIDPETGTPYKKIYDPRSFLRAGEQGMVTRLTEAFQVLGSKGRTLVG